MPLVLALDQGTTATKALAVDADRDVVARASAPTPLNHPQPGWAENDPARIREASVEALERVLEEVDPDSVEALGITNQRETTLAWHADTGEPLAPAVSWQCRRTEPHCERLRESEGAVARIRERTGLVVDPYFSATKMRWLIDEEKRVRRAHEEDALLLGTVDAFLVHGLTGAHATDPSNASRTMLYNLHEEAWDPELGDLLDVPLDPLPEVRPSSGRFGAVAEDTPLGGQLPELQGVPVAGVAGDQQASLFGHGCLAEGEAKGTLGTGAFVLANTGEAIRSPTEGVLATVAWDLGDGPTHALEATAFSCGSVLEWAGEAGWLDAPEALDEQAGAVDDADGATFVPALYGLAAPDWDPDAQAALLGLTASTTREHVARAIAEGLSAQNAGLLEALEACGQPVDAIRLDGGVSRSDLLCQLMADATDTTVQRSRESELTALGAAGLAGLEAGVWTREDLRGGPTDAFEPEGEAAFVDAYREAADAVAGLGDRS